MDQARLHRTFYALSRSIGLRGADASSGPRLHDFRHRFAVKVLTAWYESGQDSARLGESLAPAVSRMRIMCLVNSVLPSMRIPEQAAQRKGLRQRFAAQLLDQVSRFVRFHGRPFRG